LENNKHVVYPEFPDTFWSFKHALKVVQKKAGGSTLPRAPCYQTGQLMRRMKYGYTRQRDEEEFYLRIKEVKEVVEKV
jgi:hypothetical protein